MRKTYRYFVSYIGFNEEGRVYGNCELRSAFPLNRWEEIEATKKTIMEKNGFEDAIIFYFKLFGVESKWKELFREIRRLLKWAGH
jgi:hypothetical protein